MCNENTDLINYTRVTQVAVTRRYGNRRGALLNISQITLMSVYAAVQRKETLAKREPTEG